MQKKRCSYPSSMVFYAIHRTPSTIHTFLYVCTSGHTFLMRDLNAHHSAWSSKTNAKGRILYDLARTNNFRIQIPSEPTYRNKHSGATSTLDLFLTRTPFPILGPPSLPRRIRSGASDHEPIIIHPDHSWTAQSTFRISKKKLS